MAPIAEIAFRNIEVTPALRKLVESKVASLQKYFPDILRCRVMVEAPHRHRRAGTPQHVRIELFVPGACLVAGRDPALRKSHAELPVALRDAFHAARRELMDHARRVRRQVKQHVGPGVGRVTKLLKGGYGYLETEDGRQVYFHRNSVLEGFEQLRVGTRVRFNEEAGVDGPQASSLQTAGRHVRDRAGARP
jgi:ribosomal subunit interface protein